MDGVLALVSIRTVKAGHNRAPSLTKSLFRLNNLFLPIPPSLRYAARLRGSNPAAYARFQHYSMTVTIIQPTEPRCNNEA